MLGNVTSSFVFNAIEGKSNSNNASHIVEKRAAFDADTLSNVSRLQACGLNDKSHDVANNVQVIEQIAVDSSKVCNINVTVKCQHYDQLCSCLVLHLGIGLHSLSELLCILATRHFDSDHIFRQRR